MMDSYNGRSVSFEGRQFDEAEYIAVVFRQGNKEHSVQFAPFKMDVEVAIIDWMIHGKITVQPLPEYKF